MSGIWSTLHVNPWTSLIFFFCDSHKYLSLPLIPVDEFLELFPEHRESNEHDLMIARINHEHAEREKLEQARQELLKRKQALIAENKKRKDDLANLDQDLEKFIDVRAFLLTCLPADHHEFLLIDSCDFRRPNQFKRSLKRNTEENTVLGHGARSKGFYTFWRLHWAGVILDIIDTLLDSMGSFAYTQDFRIFLKIFVFRD